MAKRTETDRVRTDLQEVRENFLIYSVRNGDIGSAVIEQFVKSVRDSISIIFAECVSLRFIYGHIAVELRYIT